MGEGTGDGIMMDFLNMGGYAVYVWSSYGIVAIVLVLNILASRRRFQSVLQRMKRLHISKDKNES